ncbi:TPA: CsgG/HfaB family protein [Campylobacter jejuni]
MRVLFVSLVFFAFLNAKVVTTSTTKQAQGEGYGVTYEQAVGKALADAISRMYGGSLSQSTNFKTKSTKDKNGQNLEKSFNDEIRRATKGSFDSYEVISKIQTNDGFNVKVVIKKTTTTKKYQAPGLSADNRRSITVFDSTPDAAKRGIGSALQQKIISDLLQSRKFNVLDRDSSGYYEMEKALIKSGDAASDEVYKLKNVLATDYILLFSISGLEGKQKTSNLTGKSKTEIEVIVDYRVLLFATRQIKFSNTLSMKVNLKDNSLSANETALKQIANRISGDILNAIYPLKVAAVENNEVVFSQSLNQGDVYECFALGKAIKDTYTKENTGRVESKTGSIEITRTSPKLSYAKITEGSVKVGDICRPLIGSNSGNGYTIGRDANYETQEGGGVNLGF